MSHFAILLRQEDYEFEACPSQRKEVMSSNHPGAGLHIQPQFATSQVIITQP